MLAYIVLAVVLSWQIAGGHPSNDWRPDLIHRTIGAILIAAGLTLPILPLMFAVVALGE